MQRSSCKVRSHMRIHYTYIHNFCQFTLIKRPLFAAGPPPRARSVPRVAPTVYPVTPALRSPMRAWRPLAVGCYRRTLRFIM